MKEVRKLGDAKICSFSLDEETVRRLEKLVELSPVKINKSKVLRDLIDREYASRMGAMNAV